MTRSLADGREVAMSCLVIPSAMYSCSGSPRQSRAAAPRSTQSLGRTDLRPPVTDAAPAVRRAPQAESRQPLQCLARLRRCRTARLAGAQRAHVLCNSGTSSARSRPRSSVVGLARQRRTMASTAAFGTATSSDDAAVVRARRNSGAHLRHSLQPGNAGPARSPSRR